MKIAFGQWLFAVISTSHTSASEAGSLLISLLERWTTAAITLLIVGFFIWGATKYLRPLRQTRLALEGATKRLDSDTDPEELFTGLSPRLAALWSQFMADRRGTTVVVGDVEISTVDPAEVFTEEAVLEGYNRQMAITLAGIFTGLGILGTFIGLVIGLSNVSTDATVMIASVTQLIGGMSTAFSTSIAGIFFSLLWLLCDRTLLHSVQKHAGSFFLAVRRVYPVESADRLLHRLLAVEQEESAAIHRTNDILGDHGVLLQGGAEALTQSNLLLEEQKATLQQLGTDLAIAFQDAFNKGLSDQMAPLLEAVVKSIDSLSTQLGDRQVAAMDQMVTTFQERLSEHLHGHFEDLAEALRKTAEWQQSVHRELEGLLQRIGEATEGQRTVIERSTGVATLFQDSLDGLGKSHELIAGSARALTENFEKIVGDVGAMAEQLTDAVERLDIQAAGLVERIDELDAQHELYRTANEEIRVHLADHIDSLGEQVRSLTGFWLDFRSDLTQIGAELRESVAEFDTFMADKFKEIFARFDSEMAKVVEHLGGTLTEVREVTEDLPVGLERLRTTLTEAVHPIAQAGRAIADLGADLNGTAGTAGIGAAPIPLRHLLDEMVDRIGDSERATLRLAEQIEVANVRISDALTRMDQPAAVSE